MKKYKFFNILPAIILALGIITGAASATALSADKSSIAYTDGKTMSFSVYESTTLYLGGLVMVNADGYAVPGSDTAGGIFVGVNFSEQVDNSSGSSGDETVALTRQGCFLMTFDTAISIANVGDLVYLVDDQTVDVAANTTNDILCGKIVEYVSTTTAYVDIAPGTR